MEKKEVTSFQQDNLISECDFLRRKIAEQRSELIRLKAENLLLKKLAAKDSKYYNFPVAECAAVHLFD